MIGRPLRRLEDPRLVTGGGRFVGDICVPDLLYAVFVRSTEAHAIIEAVDMSEARRQPGVVGVYTASDLGVTEPMPDLYPTPMTGKAHRATPLATNEVCYVGEPVAVVVATRPELALDAAESVFIDVDPLPAVVGIETALDPGTPPAHVDDAGNLVAHLSVGYGDVDAAFAESDDTVQIRLLQHRGACASLEPRGVLARWDPMADRLEMWSSTQSPYPLRARVAEYMGLGSHEVRVTAPDVGGGFGPKAAIYAEEYVVARLAQLLGRPVRWIETRREHLVATLQQRDQVHDITAAVRADGKVLAVRSRILHDNGAYLPYGLILPMTGLQLAPGPYVIPAIDVQMDVVYTNKTPTNPIRGAGRPYAVFAIERLIDAVARHTGIDRAAVRRRNFVPDEAFPFQPGLTARDGKPVTYDSGAYANALDLALDAADIPGFEERRGQSAARAKLRGFGLASYIEDTGLGPFEGARVEITPTGSVVVDTGAASQGQGHATVFAQICADRLGVDPTRVIVRAADTDRYGYGISTAASRTAVTAGSSVFEAAGEVADMVRKLAADRLEVDPADLVLAHGGVHVAGQPDTRIDLADLAAAMQGTAATPLPAGFDAPGLAADRAVQLQSPAFAFGTHVAEVEVDPETGGIEVVGYVVVHDCGTILNPMIVDGQIDGGVAHGLGNALMERVAYSPDGQPLTTTFMDYRIMSATEMPPLTKIHTVTPSPLNPLGAKGAGEGGTLPAAAAVASAVEHALSARGVVVDRQPLTPDTVHALLSEAGREQESE